MTKQVFPSFSIITVVYNDADNLRKTIENVSRQSYQNVEFIIIDGGSRDATLNVIENNKQIISHWTSEKDNGIYDAMNKGLSIASGDYINFLNAGDTFHSPETLAIVASEIDATGSEIIYGQALHKSNKKGHENYVRGKLITPDALFRNIPFCHQTLFVKKQVWDEVGDYDTSYRIVADYEWMIRYYNSRRSTAKMHFIKEILIDYDTDGFSFKHIARGVSEKVRIARKNFQGRYFITGNLYFMLDRVRVLVVIALYRSGTIQYYRKLKYGFLNTFGLARK